MSVSVWEGSRKTSEGPPVSYPAYSRAPVLSSQGDRPCCHPWAFPWYWKAPAKEKGSLRACLQPQVSKHMLCGHLSPASCCTTEERFWEEEIIFPPSLQCLPSPVAKGSTCLQHWSGLFLCPPRRGSQARLPHHLAIVFTKKGRQSSPDLEEDRSPISVLLNLKVI